LEKFAMKKTLIALAALASTAAFAQSSVTLYGVLDAGITKGADSKTTFTGGGVNGTPRLGVKGSEDLGGGLSAVFQIETGLNDGKEAASSLGDRGAFVGIAGAFGTVTMGSSVLTPSFYARAATDPSATNNYGIAKFAGATRLDNSINYTSPNLSGLTLRVSMVQSDDNGTTAKNATDISAVYNNGPLTVAASSSDNGVDKGSFYGAAYNLGMATVFVNKVDTAATTTAVAGVTAAAAAAEYTSYGVSAPFGAWTLQADKRTKKSAADDTYVVSAQYALSKRTSLTAYTSKTEGAKSAVGAGVRHNF
jgi:predicted porin